MSTTVERAVGSREQRAGEPRVLLVGTFGGGGIHHYVEEQHRHLDDVGDVGVSTYDMQSSPGGEGIAWFLGSFLAALVAALRFPLRAPPDLVHVHASGSYSFYRAAPYVLFAAHVWRRPIVLHVHGSSFDEFVGTDSRPVRVLQSLVFGASDRVVVLSEYWRDVLSPHVEEEKLRVFPNAVDPADYDPSFGGEPHVVFVSNLIDRKGVPEFLEAIERVSDRVEPGFRATVAGSGGHADAVAETASRHEHVEYLGYVSEERKRALLDAGSIFVLPTHAEGLPIAMLEAMAGGNAIVSTPVGSIPEVIGEENGRLVDPGDVDALAAALEELIASPELVERMGRRNRRAVEETYAWDRIAADLVDLYVETGAREADASARTP